MPADPALRDELVNQGALAMLGKHFLTCYAGTGHQSYRDREGMPGGGSSVGQMALPGGRPVITPATRGTAANAAVEIAPPVL